MGIVFLGFLAVVLGALTGAYYSIPLLILTIAAVAGLVFVVHARRCELAQRGLLPASFKAGCEQDYVDLTDAKADQEALRRKESQVEG